MGRRDEAEDLEGGCSSLEKKLRFRVFSFGMYMHEGNDSRSEMLADIVCLCLFGFVEPKSLLCLRKASEFASAILCRIAHNMSLCLDRRRRHNRRKGTVVLLAQGVFLILKSFNCPMEESSIFFLWEL